MRHLLYPHHNFRIFFVSGAVTAAVLGLVGYYLGPAAALLTLLLIAIEMTFSFDNAIINAKVLERMSPFWQQMFLTVGILIAVFGMRILFPLVVVVAASGGTIIDVAWLAVEQPDKYASLLEHAYPGIAAFGGMFLLMLCLDFFFDGDKVHHWIEPIERQASAAGSWWVHGAISLGVLAGMVLLPNNPNPQGVLTAGVLGIIAYLTIQWITHYFSQRQGKSLTKTVALTGMAGFSSFLYLELLDASFSFDGVLGAFAITKDVLIIAAGLGVGAVWVRSFTIMLVRRRTLDTYRFLEHGAHYTIGILAIVLLAGIFVEIPEAFAGIVSIAIIAAAIFSSRRALRLPG